MQSSLTPSGPAGTAATLAALARDGLCVLCGLTPSDRASAAGDSATRRFDARTTVGNSV